MAIGLLILKVSIVLMDMCLRASVRSKEIWELEEIKGLINVIENDSLGIVIIEVNLVENIHKSFLGFGVSHLSKVDVDPVDQRL